MHKIRTHHRHIDGKIFAWMAFIFGFGVGMIFPFFPNFVKSILKTDSAVSIFFAIMALVMLVSGLSSTIIFSKVRRTSIIKVGLLVTGFTLLSFIMVSRVTELSIFQTLKVWFEMFIFIALALFVRDFAKRGNLGTQEGLYYRYQNMGYIMGPLLGGFLAVTFDYEFVFIIAASVLFGGLVYFYHKHVIQKHPAIINQRKTNTQRLFANIRDFFSNGPRKKAYLVTIVFMAWSRFKQLYVPLYVVMMGYKESLTGIIWSVSLIPLVLFEVKVGEYGNRHSVRKPMALGFLIYAISLFIIFISPYPLLNFLLIVIGTLGSALIEPLQEDFIFKHLPKDKEDELFGIYMTADPVAYFIAPAIGAVALLFLPFNFLFLIFGILMLITCIFTWWSLKHL